MNPPMGDERRGCNGQCSDQYADPPIEHLHRSHKIAACGALLRRGRPPRHFAGHGAAQTEVEETVDRLKGCEDTDEAIRLDAEEMNDDRNGRKCQCRRQCTAGKIGDDVLLIADFAQDDYRIRRMNASGQYVTRSRIAPSLNGNGGSSMTKSELPATKSNAARRGLSHSHSGLVRGAPTTCSMMPSVATM